MALDIVGNIPRLEASDTKQFTWASTITAPQTVAFHVYNTDGSTLAPEAMQSSSFFVAASGGGVFYANRVLPTSAGLYFYQWTAWDVASRTYITRGEFEIYRTEAHSFFTYADVTDVVRTGRQIFKRSDITMREVRPYLEAADGYIDGRLGKVFTVPLNPVPNIIRDMSKVFGLAYFYSDRYSTEKEDQPPPIIDRKDWYEEFLSSVVSGTAVLVTSGGVVSQVAEDFTVITGGIEGGTPQFGIRDWTEQTTDSDIKDAEADRDD